MWIWVNQYLGILVNTEIAGIYGSEIIPISTWLLGSTVSAVLISQHDSYRL